MQLNLSFPPSFPSNVANQRQEFIHEFTQAETQAVLIRNCTNLKNTGETDGKKLHSISEVKFSRSSTPFDKDPFLYVSNILGTHIFLCATSYKIPWLSFTLSSILESNAWFLSIAISYAYGAKEFFLSSPTYGVSIILGTSSSCG